MPLLVLLLAFYALGKTALIDTNYLGLLGLLPYIIFALAIGLAHYFNRSRFFSAALLLATAYWLIQGQLQTSLGRFETGFSNLTKTQAQLAESENRNAELNQQFQEAKNFIAQQKKQISLLEARMSKASSDGAQYRSRMISLQQKFDELNRRSLEQQGIHHSRLQEMEQRMREIVDRNETIEREVWDRDQAIEYFKNNAFGTTVL